MSPYATKKNSVKLPLKTQTTSLSLVYRDLSRHTSCFTSPSDLLVREASPCSHAISCQQPLSPRTKWGRKSLNWPLPHYSKTTTKYIKKIFSFTNETDSQKTEEVFAPGKRPVGKTWRLCFQLWDFGLDALALPASLSHFQFAQVLKNLCLALNGLVQNFGCGRFISGGCLTSLQHTRTYARTHTG